MIFWSNCHCGITSVYSYKIRCYLCVLYKMSFPKGSCYSNNYDTTFPSVLLSKGRGTQVNKTQNAACHSASWFWGVLHR